MLFIMSNERDKCFHSLDFEFKKKKFDLIPNFKKKKKIQFLLVHINPYH